MKTGTINMKVVQKLTSNSYLFSIKRFKGNLYGFAANPNLNPALLTAPDQVLEKLQKKCEAYISTQSVADILEKKRTTIDKLALNNEIHFMLVFDCANRAMLLADRYSELVQIYNKGLGKIPYLGIMSGGEFCPQTNPIVNMSAVSFYSKRES